MRKRIQHEYNGAIIEQRPKDGFINGTAIRAIGFGTNQLLSFSVN